MSFFDVLIKKGVISQKKLAEFLTKAQDSGIAVDKVMESEGVSEEEILSAKSEISGLPLKRISKGQVPFEVLKRIPEEAARHYKFLPLGVREGGFEVGIVDPSDIEAREALDFIVSKMSMPVTLYLISEKDFEEVLADYKGFGGEVSKALNELEVELAGVGESVVKELEKIGSKPESGMESKIVEDAPVTKIAAVILKHAISGNASDIHIEPTSDKVKVRFRVDGELHTSILLPTNIHDAIVSRIKILSNMKIDEKRKPQDGRFNAHIENRDIDFRVSTFPTFYGEKVVIRILDKEKSVKSLEQLGFSPEQLETVRKAIDKPYGMILITGPTGSGKSTTLYAMIKELDKESSNVVSLEDPIEYNMEGMSQSQVRPEIGYDFASGLRSILRQDPDMIMVGEIRDKETAQLAIHAALTGHLVFSTLHTNNAVGVIPRLVDMGVDPFLLAPTMLLAVGQRLVKTLCPDSKKEVPLTGAFKEIATRDLANIPDRIKKKIVSADKIYEGVSSPSCPSGAKGRIGVFELLYKTPELENVILTNPTEPEIVKEARRQGMVTMREDGLIKALNGLINFDEYIKL